MEGQQDIQYQVRVRLTVIKYQFTGGANVYTTMKIYRIEIVQISFPFSVSRTPPMLFIIYTSSHIGIVQYDTYT